jgi:hypothetical protein
MRPRKARLIVHSHIPQKTPPTIDPRVRGFGDEF